MKCLVQTRFQIIWGGLDKVLDYSGLVQTGFQIIWGGSDRFVLDISGLVKTGFGLMGWFRQVLDYWDWLRQVLDYMGLVQTGFTEV